jgi:hypothetical protein
VHRRRRRMDARHRSVFTVRHPEPGGVRGHLPLSGPARPFSKVVIDYPAREDEALVALPMPREAPARGRVAASSP